ncbi:MAG: M23 family metallopeptidase [Chloroflexi bacterium]|nr:M23 family metallopeptidase [Chloroflexota bacterium]
MISIDDLVGNVSWSITQKFGKTSFSISHAGWYAYGIHYGLEWGTHPGLDIAIPVLTPLFSPVSGEVILSGGTSVFTNVVGGTDPQTGQLKIRTDDGSHVILGHMRRIDVKEGERVDQGQHVGLSGYNNGPHVHVEIRIPDASLDSGLRIVSPIGSILSENPISQPTRPRLFRVDADVLSVHDQPLMDIQSPGEYQRGEVIPCNTVALAQEVKPGERAWGQISGGDFAGKWVYLGFTTEVRPGDNGVQFYIVTANTKNIRISPDSSVPAVGVYTRGSILPIDEVVDGEVVDPGQRAWGKIAQGPFEGRWAYLGSQSTLKLT